MTELSEAQRSVRRDPPDEPRVLADDSWRLCKEAEDGVLGMPFKVARPGSARESVREDRPWHDDAVADAGLLKRARRRMATEPRRGMVNGSRRSLEARRAEKNVSK